MHFGCHLSKWKKKPDIVQSKYVFLWIWLGFFCCSFDLFDAMLLPWHYITFLPSYQIEFFPFLIFTIFLHRVRAARTSYELNKKKVYILEKSIVLVFFCFTVDEIMMKCTYLCHFGWTLLGSDVWQFHQKKYRKIAELKNQLWKFIHIYTNTVKSTI